MKPDALQEALKSAAGLALKNYLQKKINELDSINSVREYPDYIDQAVELKAQKRTVALMKELLNDFIALDQDPKDPVKDEYYV